MSWRRERTQLGAYSITELNTNSNSSDYVRCHLSGGRCKGKKTAVYDEWA